MFSHSVFSVCVSGSQRWLAFHVTRTRPSWSHKLERDSPKNTLVPISLPSSMLIIPLQTQALIVYRGGGGLLYKGNLAYSPRDSRRRQIDEVSISTPVEIDQFTDNCLKKAVRSFTAMQSRCRLSCSDITFRRLLPVFRVVLFSSVHFFEIASLCNYFASHELLLRDRDITLHEGWQSTPVPSPEVVISPSSVVEAHVMSH